MGIASETTSLSFYLNHEERVRVVSGYQPWTTVLDYLRGVGMVGTKEGCATGDCGACTAVTVSLVGDKLVYESLNTCIALLPSIAGRLLITVEGLVDAEGNLHPVQQAMVVEHGSQCGFCTPGFVMSLFAHVKNGVPGGREGVVTRLSGNLCRCTGYLPIVRAGMKLNKKDGKDAYTRVGKTIKERLRKLRTKDATSVLRPRTLAALATRMLHRRRPRIVAGSTDLGLEITQNLVEPELVFTNDVQALIGITPTATHWKIGAGTTWAECDKVLGKHLPGFAELMRRFGSPQIRAHATVGGNLGNASPIADGPPVFLALGCTVILRKGKERRKVHLEDFYTGYRQTVLRSGEFIEAVHLRRPPRGSMFDVYKVSKRIEDDISSVCGAFLVSLDKTGKVTKARIAYGGMAATPLRARLCETALQGQLWNEETIAIARRELQHDYQPITDQRASAAYRTMVAGNLLWRFYLVTTGVDAPLSVLAA